jgi:hypothetical protein
MEPSLFDSLARRFARRKLPQRSRCESEWTEDSSIEEFSVHNPSSLARKEFMFVQSYRSGRIEAKSGDESRYVVTLEDGLGHTVYFSDRPDRIVGATPTGQFLRGLGFAADNPPNAAMVIHTSEGRTDIAVVELFDPIFDPDSASVTYEMDLLANWQSSADPVLDETPFDLAGMSPGFGPAQLFIDACPTTDISCDCYDHRDPNNPQHGLATIVRDADMCWNYSLCQPCEPYGHELPSRCATYDYWNDMCKNLRPELECTPSWSWVMPPYCDF